MELRGALRMLRSEIGMTQAELAAAVNVGYCAENRWENKNIRPNKASSMAILKLAENRGVSATCLDALNRLLMASRADDKEEKEQLQQITEQMKLEQRLLLSSDQMKATIDNLDLAVIGQRFLSGKAETCKVFYSNKYYYKMLGYSREEFESKLSEDVLFAAPPEYRKILLDKMGELISHKVSVNDFVCTIKQICKDGSEVWVEIKAGSLTEYSFGQELFTFCRNVTRTVESERQYDYEVAIRDASLQTMYASIHCDLTSDTVLRYSDIYAVTGKEYSGETASQIYKCILDNIPAGAKHKDFQQRFSPKTLLSSVKTGNIGEVYIFNIAAKRWLRCEYVLVKNHHNEHVEILMYFYDIQRYVLTDRMISLFSEHFFEYIGLIDVEEKTIESYNTISTQYSKAGFQKRTYPSNETLHLNNPDTGLEADSHMLSLGSICAELEKAQYYAVLFQLQGSNGQPIIKRITYAYLDDSKKVVIVTQSDVNHIKEECGELQTFVFHGSVPDLQTLLYGEKCD